MVLIVRNSIYIYRQLAKALEDNTSYVIRLNHNVNMLYKY